MERSVVSELMRKWCLLLPFTVRRLAMKGNALLLSMLLLMSGAAYSMEEVVDGVTSVDPVVEPTITEVVEPVVEPTVAEVVEPVVEPTVAEVVEAPSVVEEAAEVVAEAQEAVASRLDAMKARLGAAWGWVGSKTAAAKDKIADAWRNKPTISDIKSKIPTLQDIKAACALRNIKEKALNLPTTINNHKLATGLIISIPVATFVAWKLWKQCKELQQRSKARERVL